MRLVLAVPIVLALAGTAFGQTPTPPAPAQPAPAAPRPRPRAAAPSTATATLTVTVTDASGSPLADVKVSAVGPLEREGVTTAAGQVRLLGIRAGTYRVRFERDGFHTFEKEVTWRAGTPAPVAEATLTSAPPPPAPPPRTGRAGRRRRPDLRPGPASGQATTICRCSTTSSATSSRDKEPQKESLIGCSGSAQSWLWQIREPWQGRRHE